jgi:hypothetical protein
MSREMKAYLVRAEKLCKGIEGDSDIPLLIKTIKKRLQTEGRI